jgi:enediyne biosynthesis protein E4
MRIALAMASCWIAALLLAVQSGSGPIHFSYRPIAFVLENSETPMRYAPETMAGGVAVFDYNKDGKPDIFFTNGATIPGLKKSDAKYANRLFRNDGNGVFTDVTRLAGLAGTGYDTGVAVGDYNNDGYPDLFVAGVHRNTLYRNNGNGTFTDVTAAAGLAGPDPEFGPLWSVGGVWFDFDNDGKLDLFVTDYLSWAPDKEPECLQKGKRDYCHPKYFEGTPNRLYRNNGDGTFTDVSAAAGIRAFVGKGMGAAMADFNQDGRPDIFVANDKMANFLFLNLGQGKFREVALEAGVAWPERGVDISGMGVDFRDIDNDGLPDVFFVALDNETFPLFRNTGKGFFQERTRASGLEAATLAMSGYSPGIYDFDNDGWKDIFVSRGHVQSREMEGMLAIEQHNSVFRNLGNGKLAALTAEAGLDAHPRRRHRGAAFGDFDGDGRIDVVVSALGAEAEIWQNDSPGSNHWLAIELVGTASNRDGIGAVVKVVSASGTQYNHMTTAVGYASSSAGPVHFGLGKDTAAQLVEIRWPSGRLQQLKDVGCDHVVRVVESGPRP